MKHIFVTGQPGCGKTTLISKIADDLSRQGLRLRGFYTDEVRYMCVGKIRNPKTFSAQNVAPVRVHVQGPN